MRRQTFALGLFVALTTLFASLTLIEFTRGSTTITSSLTTSALKSTVTETVIRTLTANRTIYQPFPPPPNGLVLRAFINASTITSGQAISAKAEVYNALAERVTVTLNHSNSYFSYLNLNDWRNYNSGLECAPPNSLLVQLAVFKGVITAANFSHSVPLQIAPLLAIPCPFFPDPTSTTFLPYSNATAGMCGNEPNCLTHSTISLQHEECKRTNQGYLDCSSVTGALGTWDGTPNPTRSSYKPFPAGEYTVVAFDMWGQTQFLYFNVVNQ